MKARERVLASIERKAFDRLPIKHQAEDKVNEMLLRHFGLREHQDLLNRLGHDFREVGPVYCGPDTGWLHPGQKVYTAGVWSAIIRRQRPGVELPLADIESVAELRRFTFPTADLYVYSTIASQCEQNQDYARVLGYCEMDLINSLSGERGYEQVLMDIATRNPVYLELVQRRFEFIYEHARRALEAAPRQIELVHLGDDLGTQQGLLLSPATFRDVFGAPYRAIFDLIHRHGARSIMHICGSIAGMLPTLIDLGLDVLDVVQTNAAGMDIERLHREFGRYLTFSGTMCVQHVIPFGTPAQVKAEVEKRQHLFRDGGLIIGPSHLLQPDSPLENILMMYRTAGGLQ